MKKEVLIATLLFLILLFVNGCVNISAPACGNNYYEFKKGECCADLNNNQVCDNDESEDYEEKRLEEEKAKTEEKEALDRIKKQIEEAEKKSNEGEHINLYEIEGTVFENHCFSYDISTGKIIDSFGDVPLYRGCNILKDCFDFLKIAIPKSPEFFTTEIVEKEDITDDDLIEFIKLDNAEIRCVSKEQAEKDSKDELVGKTIKITETKKYCYYFDLKPPKFSITGNCRVFSSEIGEILNENNFYSFDSCFNTQECLDQLKPFGFSDGELKGFEIDRKVYCTKNGTNPKFVEKEPGEWVNLEEKCSSASECYNLMLDLANVPEDQKEEQLQEVISSGTVKCSESEPEIE